MEKLLNKIIQWCARKLRKKNKNLYTYTLLEIVNTEYNTDRDLSNLQTFIHRHGYRKDFDNAIDELLCTINTKND